jgi:triosephosphate isomerase
MKKTPLVVANWKMHPGSSSAAKSLMRETAKALARTRGVDVAVAPPSVFLGELQPLIAGKKLRLAAQNVFYEKLGAYTGEVSVPMLKSVGAALAIVGHSERRALGETDELVNKKARAVIAGGLAAIACVGESKRDARGDYLSFVEKQLRAACAGVSAQALGKLVIAYEPIWAIGTGTNATPHDAHEMKLFIQRILTDTYGRAGAAKVRILYGGSVTAKNAGELMQDGAVDGFLVGGASLRAAEFASICRSAASS